MPKTQSEEEKKHGDKFESLVDRASGSPSGEADEIDDDDDSTLLQDDDDDDPTLLQDDDEEDVQNDEK